MKPYSIAVFIGRFSPVHNGHIQCIREAMDLADTVLILLGSSNRPRTPKNIFSDNERIHFIQGAFKKSELDKIRFEKLEDILYNDQVWVSQVQKIVARYEMNDNRISLVGHKKDASSYYVDLFPQWNFHPVDGYKEKDNILSSTDIRKSIFDGGKLSDLDHIIPDSVIKRVVETVNLNKEVFDELREEHFFIEKYKEQWNAAPYPVIFHTVDAVVVQGGNVLMVKRKERPGKGLLALPGGFIKPSETLLEAMIRELREETKIKVPIPVLKGNIKKYQTFDAVGRSLRGRTITTAFFIELPPVGSLPKVKGADDAEKAMWLPLSKLSSMLTFEDHYDIISVMIGDRTRVL